MTTPRAPGTRAKDSDRTETCQLLDDALADGQLSMAEHRQRVSSATNAATLGELYALTADLQISKPAQPPATRRWKLRSAPVVFAMIAAVTAVILVAVAWAVLSDNEAPTPSTPSPAGQTPEKHALAAEATTTASAPTSTQQDPAPLVLTPPENLHTAEAMTRVLDEMRNRFGDTMGYELAVMADEAILARPDPTNDQSKLIYTYEGGWADPSDRPRSDTDDLTDLGAFDVAAAAAALQNAPQTLKIAPGDVRETFFDVDHIAEPPGPGALELLVKITTTDGRNGLIYLDPAANVKHVEYPG